MRIYFVRHGESHANLLHEISNRGLRHGLTRTGRAQAKALAERLQGLPIMHIYSSPVLRAIETSIIVANHLGVDYEITDALREYDCGILEGCSDEAAWQGWQELFDAWMESHEWDKCLEGGESFHDIRKRFEPFINELITRYKNTDAEVACVSHGGLYRTMLPLVLKNVDNEFISRHGLDYTTCVIAEWRSAELVCAAWNGHKIER